MNLSKEGFDHLVRFEGMYGKVYDDVASESEKRKGLVSCDAAQGTPTIGIGYVIKASWIDECNKYMDYLRDGDKTLSESEQIQLFNDHLPVYENWVNKAVSVPINQKMFDALLIHVFNVGSGSSSFKNAVSFLNKKDYENSAASIRDGAKKAIGGQKLSGLAKRRNFEADYFLEGVNDLTGISNKQRLLLLSILGSVFAALV